MENKAGIPQIIILAISLLMPLLSIAQDYEESITNYSEKFLTYSQSFVNHASQNVNTDVEYDAALALSDIAEEFHQHTSYLGDYLLILKIINKHEVEKELAQRLVRLRIESIIKECNAALEGIGAATANVESESITAMANDLSGDLEALKKVLTKINDQFSGTER